MMSTSTLYRHCSPALALIASLAGCSGQTASGALVPAAATQTRLATPASPTTQAHADGGASPLSIGFNMFTANYHGGSILAFSSKANGDVTPIVKIAGSNTTLTDPHALAFDGTGHIYAANDGATSVAVFDPNANGNVKPIRIVGGSNSHLGPTEGLLVDLAGDLWVSDDNASAITEYAPGAKGNVAPINTISGSNTQLNLPLGMVMNTNTGQLFVVNYGPLSSSILVFAKGASGNATPIGVIAGSNTTLSSPEAVAFDASGRLLVADEGSGVLVFGNGALGNVAPVQRITSLQTPTGVMGDAHGHIYAAGDNTIKEYASTANGNATPLRTISGPKTTLNGPFYLEVH